MDVSGPVSSCYWSSYTDSDVSIKARLAVKGLIYSFMGFLSEVHTTAWPHCPLITVYLMTLYEFVDKMYTHNSGVDDIMSRDK